MGRNAAQLGALARTVALPLIDRFDAKDFTVASQLSKYKNLSYSILL